MPRRWSVVREDTSGGRSRGLLWVGCGVSDRRHGNMIIMKLALRFVALGFALLAPGVAYAACSSPLSVNAGPALQNFGITCDGSANAYANYAIVDGANAGNLLVNIKTAGTLTVSGTVTVTGVSTAANQTNVQAVVGGGTAPASQNVVGGQYRVTPLVLTDLQSSALQLGVGGGLIIDPTNLTITDASTTAGQRGSLTMCATTTGNPTYITAKSDYCSLTTAGALRGDLTSIAGTVPDTNSGNKSAGTLRTVLATDQPNLTTALNVRLTDGTNPSVFTASAGSALTTNAALVVAVSPNPTAVCNSRIAINQTASADILTSTNKIYICSIDLVIAGAEQVSIIEGTGTVCATGTAALWGGTTADATHGMPFGVNGGFSKTAERPFAQTLTAGDHLCLLKSGSTLLAGAIWYTDHT